MSAVPERRRAMPVDSRRHAMQTARTSGCGQRAFGRARGLCGFRPAAFALMTMLAAVYAYTRELRLVSEAFHGLQVIS